MSLFSLKFLVDISITHRIRFKVCTAACGAWHGLASACLSDPQLSRLSSWVSRLQPLASLYFLGHAMLFSSPGLYSCSFFCLWCSSLDPSTAASSSSFKSQLECPFLGGPPQSELEQPLQPSFPKLLHLTRSIRST